MTAENEEGKSEGCGGFLETREEIKHNWSVFIEGVSWEKKKKV